MLVVEYHRSPQLEVTRVNEEEAPKRAGLPKRRPNGAVDDLGR